MAGAYGSIRTARLKPVRRTSLFFLCLALAAAPGCSKKDKEEDDAKETAQAAPVQVTAVTQEPIRRVVEAEGVLYPLDQSSIMPKVSAPVLKFFVNRGDHVKAGQVVATLENRDLAAAVAESKGLLDQAESNYRATSAAAVPEAVVKAQADVQAAQQAMEAAQKVLESRQKLLEQGALARRLVDESQAAYAQAKGQYDAVQEHLLALQSVGKEEQVKGAQAQVASARGHLQSAEAQLSYTEVRSPISGVVADRPLYAGDMASTGVPFITVMDTSSVVARANVPQNQAATIKVGAPATLSEAGSDAKLSGKVTVVSPATDPASTTVQVWVQAANPGERFKPGTGVRAAIVTETIPKAVVVPSAALLGGEEGGTIVLTVSGDSVAHQHKVETGAREADKVQILSGVSPGEQVVVAGGVGVADKAKVRIVKPGEEDEGDKGGKDEDDKKGEKGGKGSKDDDEEKAKGK